MCNCAAQAPPAILQLSTLFSFLILDPPTSIDPRSSILDLPLPPGVLFLRMRNHCAHVWPFVLSPMGERRRGYSSSPKTEAASAEATPITLKLGADEVRKLKETVISFNPVLGSIEPGPSCQMGKLPGPSCLATSEHKGGIFCVQAGSESASTPFWEALSREQVPRWGSCLDQVAWPRVSIKEVYFVYRQDLNVLCLPIRACVKVTGCPFLDRFREHLILQGKP